MSAVVSAADAATGSFNGALVFVGANALVGPPSPLSWWSAGSSGWCSNVPPERSE